jgi:hypothetical protein
MSSLAGGPARVLDVRADLANVTRRIEPGRWDRLRCRSLRRSDRHFVALPRASQVAGETGSQFHPDRRLHRSCCCPQVTTVGGVDHQAVCPRKCTVPARISPFPVPLFDAQAQALQRVAPHANIRRRWYQPPLAQPEGAELGTPAAGVPAAGLERETASTAAPLLSRCVHGASPGCRHSSRRVSANRQVDQQVRHARHDRVVLGTVVPAGVASFRLP